MLDGDLFDTLRISVVGIWLLKSNSGRVTQVRRKADGAKNLVKEWLADWRDSPLVAQDPSHSQIQGMNGRVCCHDWLD